MVGKKDSFKKRGKSSKMYKRAKLSRVKRNFGKQVVHRHFRWTPYEGRIQVTIPMATAGNPGLASYGLAYSINQLVNQGELAGLYDQYKIVRAYTRFNYNYSVSDVTTWTSAGNGKGVEMLICNDYDDISIGAGSAAYDQLAQRSTTKRARFTNNKPTITWKCRPKVNHEVYRSALTTAYAPKSSWLDFAYTDIPHYGTKIVFINPFPSEVTIEIDVGMTVLCRGTR